jgi:hypothetical protein
MTSIVCDWNHHENTEQVPTISPVPGLKVQWENDFSWKECDWIRWSGPAGGLIVLSEEMCCHLKLFVLETSEQARYFRKSLHDKMNRALRVCI